MIEFTQKWLDKYEDYDIFHKLDKKEKLRLSIR